MLSNASFLAKFLFDTAEHEPAKKFGKFAKTFCKIFQLNIGCDPNARALDFSNIAQACWLAIVSMTTVGYGEKYPKTLQGRLVALLGLSGFGLSRPK